MAIEDPFFSVKDEVLLALVRTRRLWSRLEYGQKVLQSPNSKIKPPKSMEGVEHFDAEELQWTRTELKNALRSIEWDLEDLDDTIQIVEKNPNQFRIDPTEISVRKNFIKTTKQEVMRLKNLAFKDEGGAKQLIDEFSNDLAATTATPLLAEDVDDTPTPSDTLRPKEKDWLRHQRDEEANQDEQLVIMSESMDTLRTMSEQIGQELDEQAAMLDEFGTEIEHAETKLDATMKKMSKVLHLSTDKRQWLAIVSLAGAILLVFFLLVLL